MAQFQQKKRVGLVMAVVLVVVVIVVVAVAVAVALVAVIVVIHDPAKTLRKTLQIQRKDRKTQNLQ